MLAFPNLFETILSQGHSVGNHTYDHLNGWKECRQEYIQNIKAASKLISSNLFRPPYGRIKPSQIKSLRQDSSLPQQIILWDVLSADFDTRLNGLQCAQHVIKNALPGSIVVFHDSAKAWERLQVALPIVLDHFTSLGYSFEAII